MIRGYLFILYIQGQGPVIKQFIKEHNNPLSMSLEIHPKSLLIKSSLWSFTVYLPVCRNAGLVLDMDLYFKLIYDGSFERAGISPTSIVRLQHGWVLAYSGSGNVNRSFISTAIVNDSLAYGDDLRKYACFESGRASRTCPTTRRPTWERTCSSSSSSRPSRSNDSRRR